MRGMTKQWLQNRLKELCALDGVAGDEGAIRAYIRRHAESLASDILIDPIGNLLVFKEGAERPEKPLMLAAHMDECGFRVQGFQDDGTLRLAPVGDPALVSLPGSRVLIGDKKIRGVIASRQSMFARDTRRVLPPSELILDIGASDKSAAEKVVSLADAITFDSPWLPLGGDRVKAKALENRIGCSVLMGLLEEELPFDTWFAFTACGTIRVRQFSGRGASVAVSRVDPGILILVGCKEATDFSALPQYRRMAFLGKGAIVSIADAGTPYTRPLRERFTLAAGEAGIPWQHPTGIGPSVTEARTAAVAASGAASACLSAPVRYMRTGCPVADLRDLEALYRMSRLSIMEAGGYHV